MYRVCPNCDFSCVEYYAPPVCPWCRGARGEIVQLELSRRLERAASAWVSAHTGIRPVRGSVRRQGGGLSIVSRAGFSVRPVMGSGRFASAYLIEGKSA